MKKGTIILLGAFAITLASCGGTADYKPSAEAMCKCMEEKDAEPKGEYDLGRDVDYASCVLDVILENRVDINNEEFGKVLKEECPDLTDLHKTYMETSSEE
ncbi:MAG: hypothetical protein WED10_12695 [Brumimicrobium sp.]